MKLTQKNSMLKLSVENSPWIFKQFSINWNSLKQSLMSSSRNFITSLQVYWKWIPLQVLFKFFFVLFRKCILQDITWWLLPFCYLWNMQNVAKTIKQQKQSQWDDLLKRCSWKYRKFHRKTPVPESLFLLTLQAKT